MTLTDYAGILGLLAAAAVAAWMLLGSANTSPHRGDPRHSAPLTPRPARHRASSSGRVRAR